MLAIYKRELRAHMNSFIGLLFTAVSLFFVGIYYTSYQLLGGYPYFSVTMNNVSGILWMTVPVLCMKVFSEERHNKTDQLTLTAPVTVGQIVLGKYLALLSVLGITTLITCVYPLIMAAYGKILVGETYIAILGYFLYGAASIAVCVLISALTESQVIAAVLGFVALLLGNLTGALGSMISVKGNWFTNALAVYDLATPFTKLLNGIFDIPSVVYFFTVIGFSLFLTTQVIQKRRYSVSVKQLSMGAYSTGMIAVVTALVVIINLFLGKLPSTMTVIDFSAQKLYSLTDTTEFFLDRLDQDVRIYVMADKESADPTVEHTLSRYDDYSDHINVVYVDPVTNPTFITKYTSDSVSLHSLVVESDKRHKVIDYSDLWVWAQSGNSTIQAGYDAEGQITGAISYVTSEKAPVIYVSEGHSELEVPEDVLSSLSKESVEVENVSLMNLASISTDVCALLIHSPKLDFNDYETQLVLDYMNKGGIVIFVTGSVGNDRPNCDKILAQMGLELVDGMIVEGNTDFYYQNQLFLLPNIESTVYTEDIKTNQYKIFAPYAQGVIVAEENTAIVHTPILNTSRKSFSRVDLAATHLEETEKDISGPFYVGIEAVNERTEGKLIVYSCSDIFVDNVDSVSNGTNQTLLVNTIVTSVDVELDITVPEKSYLVDNIMVPTVTIVVLGAVTVFILPITLLITAFVIWFKRRRR